jgi:hypothetical protein
MSTKEQTMKIRARILAISAAALLAPLAAMSADTKAEGKTRAKAEKPAAVCEQVTGSRIKPRDATSCEKSSNQRYRSFTAEELQQTGSIDLAEALRKLDPAFR